MALCLLCILLFIATTAPVCSENENTMPVPSTPNEMMEPTAELTAKFRRKVAERGDDMTTEAKEAAETIVEVMRDEELTGGEKVAKIQAVVKELTDEAKSDLAEPLSVFFHAK